MAHEHAHGAAAESTYFLDQMLTVVSAGLLGAVALLMYSTGMLNRMLAPKFFWMVATGGIVILVLAAIRAVAIFQLAGERRSAVDAFSHDDEHSHPHAEKPAAPGHEHSHAHDDNCGHEDHGHAHAHAHSHSHGGHAEHGAAEEEVHDHGWAPWKYAVLILPVVLYSLDLPKASYSAARINRELGGKQSLIDQRTLLAQVAGASTLLTLKKSGPPIQASFTTLADAAGMESKREQWDGSTVILRGQYKLIGDGEFTLFVFKMNCCSADQIPLKARIVAPEVVQGVSNAEWVQVEGELEFMRVAGQNDWVPVIRVPSMKDIKRIEPLSASDAI